MNIMYFYTFCIKETFLLPTRIYKLKTLMYQGIYKYFCFSIPLLFTLMYKYLYTYSYIHTKTCFFYYMWFFRSFFAVNFSLYNR